MKQDPRGQIPGIDLAFADGNTGRIWGVSGVDDIHGASFEKAASYVRRRANQDGAFDWTITINLTMVISSGATPLLHLLFALGELVQEKPLARNVLVRWHVDKDNESMRLLAEELKEAFDKRFAGLTSAKLELDPP